MCRSRAPPLYDDVIYLLFLRGAPLRLPKAPKSSIPAPTQGKRPADVDEAAFEGEGLGGGGEGQRCAGSPSARGRACSGTGGRGERERREIRCVCGAKE